MAKSVHREVLSSPASERAKELLVGLSCFPLAPQSARGLVAQLDGPGILGHFPDSVFPSQRAEGPQQGEAGRGAFHF